MNNQPAQTRPAHPVLATLVTVWNATFGLIIGPKGFFGPGFFSDFKEGCKKGTRPRVKPAEEEEANGFWCNLDRTDPLDPFDYDGYDNYLNYLKRQ